MLSANEGAAGTAPQLLHRPQFYSAPERLSTVLAPLKRRLRRQQIDLVLGELLLALRRPCVTRYDQITLLMCLDGLLRRYVELNGAV